MFYVKIFLVLLMRRRKDSWVEKKEPLNPNRKTDRKKETAYQLNEIMKQNNLSDKDVSQLFGVVPSTIRAYRNAIREIPTDKMVLLERKFNNTYNSDSINEKAFTINYRLLDFLKKCNITDIEQFKCVQCTLLDLINNKYSQNFINNEVEESIDYYTDKSVQEKHIESEKLNNICHRISQTNEF